MIPSRSRVTRGAEAPRSLKLDASIATPLVSAGPARTRSGGTGADTLISVLIGWNRYQVGRVVGGVILVWVIGAVGLYLAEDAINARLRN